MAAEHNPEIRPDLTASDMTIQSDSENYGNNELSPSPSSSSGSPLILYKNPTVWSIMRGAAINLFLPFVNGLMLGWGELFAHEIAFQFGWSTTRVFPSGRRSRPVGPGIEVRDNPMERKRREGDMLDITSLE